MRFNTASAALALGLLGTGLALPQQPVPAVAPPPQGPTVQPPTAQGPTAPSDRAQDPTVQDPTVQVTTVQAPAPKAPIEKPATEKAPTTNANFAKAVEQIKKINSNLLDASKLLKEFETENPAVKAFLTQAAGVVDVLASGVQLNTATKVAAVKEPAVKEPAQNKLAEKEPAQNKLAETEPAENKLAEKEPAENKLAEKETAIANGSEKGDDVNLDVGNTKGPVDNSVKGVDPTVKSTAKLEDIDAETPRLLDAGKITGAYDPEWEYEARELRKLLEEE